MARRARLDPETRRAQLVETALALLDQASAAASASADGNGDAGVPFSVDEVADAAGVSRSLVYAYFGDRNGLAAEAYLRILERLDGELGLDLPPDDAALRRIVGACMSFAQRNRAAWRMVVSDPSRQHRIVQAARAERAARIAAAWSAASPAQPARLGDGEAGALAAEAALGMLESGILHYLDNPDLPAEQAASLLSALLSTGLRGR